MSESLPILRSTPLTGRFLVQAYVELTKPRISALALAAAAVGCLIALPEWRMAAGAWLVFHTLTGTALAAAGANSLNQWLESDFDRLMPRTQNRPLPTERLSPPEVLSFGATSSLLGVAYLAILVNELAALLAAASITLYVFAYTPLKRVSSLCVFAGAVPGALPPVIGYAAGAGRLDLEAWFLFAILYFWQLPHFATIGWMYRKEYAGAGFTMPSTHDADGVRTDLHLITHSLALLVASVLPTIYGRAGEVYTIGALVLGTAFLAFGAAFVLKKTPGVARRHVLASVTYLPCLLLLMLVDKVL